MSERLYNSPGIYSAPNPYFEETLFEAPGVSTGHNPCYVPPAMEIFIDGSKARMTLFAPLSFDEWKKSRTLWIVNPQQKYAYYIYKFYRTGGLCIRAFMKQHSEVKRGRKRRH